MMSERIEFKTNIPTTITLAFPEGKNVPSKFGSGTQTMLTDQTGRVAFVPAFVGARIAGLKLQAGSIVQIVRTERAGGKKGFDWNVQTLGAQSDGTYVIPKTGGPDDSSPEFTSGPTNATKTSSGTAIVLQQPTAHSERVSIVEAHARRLIDLQAGLMQYAQKYGGAVSRDDVRTILISVYIQNRNLTTGRRAHR